MPRYELGYSEKGSTERKTKIFDDLPNDNAAIQAALDFLGDDRIGLGISYVCTQPMINALGLAAYQRKAKETKQAA